ncbi:MAG: DUF896 domain-containing protein [Firmicutes bacterium]|nr:DUF896 domain-containing protein [[Eubacterium] siraeum]MCM1487528.1 DUF896 domain-containing protein [Bacillota bacterium]
MDKKKIERINLLARKSKSEGLTEAEKTEQKALRDEYRAEFRKSLSGQLDNTFVIDEQGNKIRLSDYNKADRRSSDRKDQK